MVQYKLTKGGPAFRRPSEVCSRGFCPACGSPLFMKYDADDQMDVALGSLADPQEIEPDYIYEYRSSCGGYRVAMRAFRVFQAIETES